MNSHCTYPANTQLTMLRSGSTYTIAQENHYYPFGMRISTMSTNPISLGTERNNAYLYNGKEFNDDMGLNWNDYGVRFYDAQIGRWHSVDQLAEKYYPISPYSYVANNPIIFIDPDGREIRTTNSTNVQRAIQDIQEIYPEANVDFERRTRPSFTIFGFEFGEIEYFSVTIDGESDFDWSQDTYSSALYDIIASDEVVFNVFYQEKGPIGNVVADFQLAGGGYMRSSCFHV